MVAFSDGAAAASIGRARTAIVISVVFMSRASF
jgi:hypothetical protein